MVNDRPERQVLSRLDPAALIHDARQLAGLTQAELARRIGTSQAAISRWEHGLDTPRVDTLGRLLQACGFEADLTFRRHDDEDRSQIAHMLTLTPDQRTTHFRSAINAFNIARAAGEARRSA